jgi:hypothetical protein
MNLMELQRALRQLRLGGMARAQMRATELANQAGGSYGGREPSTFPGGKEKWAIGKEKVFW